MNSNTYLSKWPNVCVRITKSIGLNCKIYWSKFIGLGSLVRMIWPPNNIGRLFCKSFDVFFRYSLVCQTYSLSRNFNIYWNLWCLSSTYEIWGLNIFVGPRCPWSDLWVRVSVRHWVMFVKLWNWCDSIWWRYQLNTN